MRASTRFQLGIWLLTLATVKVALLVWWPATEHLTSYTLFPIFGLIAFSLMWVHYVAGALRRYWKLPEDVLATHVRLTGYIVLFCILAHPFLLDFQLYLDGLGLPPQSLLGVYPSLLEHIAILSGVTALLCFLLFELHHLYKQKSWWTYVEWANVGAMFLILFHGFTLGGAFRHPWFQLVWAFYGITLVASVAYSSYYKRRISHGTKT